MEEEGEMGMEHMKKAWMKGGEMGMERRMMMMKMLWDKLDDNQKKQLIGQKLDEKIMKLECKVKIKQHKLETLRMIKQWLQK